MVNGQPSINKNGQPCKKLYCIIDYIVFYHYHLLNKSTVVSGNLRKRISSHSFIRSFVHSPFVRSFLCSFIHLLI